LARRRRINWTCTSGTTIVDSETVPITLE